jgi:DNA-binding NtrC family response regulator
MGKIDGELSGAKILLVEDNMITAIDHADQLHEGGAEVVGPFTTVGSAIDILKTVEFDAAVIDFVLEDSNSEALQEALESKKVPFVVVTGYPPVLVRRDIRQTVLSKPVPLGQLCATVRAAWRHE